MIKLADYPFSLSVLLNANYADGIDTTRIWMPTLKESSRWISLRLTPVVFAILKLLVSLRVTGYPEIRLRKQKT